MGPAVGPQNPGRPHLDVCAGSISMAPCTGALETSRAASRCTAPQFFFAGANDSNVLTS